MDELRGASKILMAYHFDNFINCVRMAIPRTAKTRMKVGRRR